MRFVTALILILGMATAAWAGPQFGSDSAKITNPYFNVGKVGDFIMLEGYERYRGFFMYETARSVQTVDGVQCLYGARYLIPKENTDSTREVYNYCAAQDVDGNVWVLKEMETEFGADNAMLAFPATPKVGTTLGMINNDQPRTIVGLDQTVTTRDYGEFTGCVMIREELIDNPIVRYHAPGKGMVQMGNGSGSNFQLQMSVRK